MEILTEHIKNKVEGGTQRISKKKEALQTRYMLIRDQSILSPSHSLRTLSVQQERKHILVSNNVVVR